jgi:O-antigen biosynthesis protein
MSNTATPPICFCIAGHGRSGSSLITEMFQTAGVDVGSRLMAAHESNPRGHFEDLDFHEWHVSALTANGLRYEGYETTPVVPVPDGLVPSARSLVDASRAGGLPWAWKEPRTTLFLDFWADLVPELRFVLLFRSPWEVVDSVYRRGDEVYQPCPSRAVRVWENYNRAVIDFHDRFPDRTVIVESLAAASDPESLTRSVLAKFGYDLRPANGVYEPALFRRDPDFRHRDLFERVFPEAVALYGELRDRASVTLPLDPLPVSTDPQDRDWAVRYWAGIRAAEKKLRHEQAELERVREFADRSTRRIGELERGVAELEHAHRIHTAEIGRMTGFAEQLQRELVSARSDLGRTAGQLQKTCIELETRTGEAVQLRTDLRAALNVAERVQYDYARTVEGLRTGEREFARAAAIAERSGQDLAAAERRIEHLEGLVHDLSAEIGWMRSSRFWRLRHLWQAVRHPLAATGRILTRPSA